MRAVNLLPSDLRGAAPKAARVAGPEPVQGIGAYVVLGVLALCVAAFAGYILTTNGIKQREANVEAIKQRSAAATAEAAALKPYADFQALASTRVETVRGLAAARFDWERALRDVSRAVPANVKLSALNGDMGLPGSSASSGDPLRGSIQAPALTMTGCAPTQTGVARMMTRIKAVDGVTRVSLSKSEKATDSATAGAATTSPCEGGDPATFSLVVFFERAAALDAYAASSAAATTSSVPVPNAVNQAGGAAAQANGTQPADGSATTAGTDSAAQQPEGTSSTSTSTSTTTSTTAGGTP